MNSYPSINDQAFSWRKNAFLYVVAVLAVSLRLTQLSYPFGSYLWAEDGVIFINQSQVMGIWSLFQPYQGYLHLYPRLVAYISSYFPLIARPTVLLAGWFFAYALTVGYLIRLARSVRLSYILSCFSLLVVALQPNIGENYFNITNSQWLLAVVLVITMISEDGIERRNITELITVVVCGLTGPFCIVFLPVALWDKFFWRRSFQLKHKLLMLCAAIQFFLLISGNRLSQPTADSNPWDWALAFQQIAFFNAGDRYTFFCALIFWVTTISYFFFSKMELAAEKVRILQLLWLASGLLVLSAMYVFKDHPTAIVALGSGSRYSFVPVILTCFAAFVVCERNRAVSCLVGASVFLIGIWNFSVPTRLDLRFGPFAKFAAVADVSIPLSPQWGPVPNAWDIKSAPGYSREAPRRMNEIRLVLQQSTVVNGTSFVRDGRFFVAAVNNDIQVYFSQRLMCKKDSDVAVEFNVNRKDGGWLQLFWASAHQDFTERNSMRRWYPSGHTLVQFAFSTDGFPIYLRFDPSETPGEISISDGRVFCLS